MDDPNKNLPYATTNKTNRQINNRNTATSTNLNYETNNGQTNFHVNKTLLPVNQHLVSSVPKNNQNSKVVKSNVTPPNFRRNDQQNIQLPLSKLNSNNYQQ